MRANELIPILAERFRYPFESAYRIDRALAEAGLRARGKGRNLPEMSRKEALIFLIACMVADKITKADEEVLPWISTSAKVNQLPPPEPDNGWERDADDEAAAYSPGIYSHYLKMEKHISTFRGAEREYPFVEYLLLLCSLISTNELEPGNVELEMDLSGLVAAVHFLDEHGERFFTEYFLVSNSATGCDSGNRPLQSCIQRKCTVGGAALAEITLRT